MEENAGPQVPGEPAETVDAVFTTWVRGDSEWAGMMARNIERAVDNPAWDAAMGGSQKWPKMLATALYKRLWALAGEPPGGDPERSAHSLAAECAARGVEGAKTWIEAAQSAADGIERTTASPMLRMAHASALAGLAHGTRQWERCACTSTGRAPCTARQAASR